MPFLQTRNPMLDTRRIHSFRSFIEDNARLYSELPVYVYKRDRLERSLSYSELYENVNAFGTYLCSRELAGKKVAVIGEAAPEYITALYAVVIAGGIAVPVDKELADENIIDLLTFGEIDAIVAMPAQAQRIASICSKIPGVRYLISASEKEDIKAEAPVHTAIFSKALEEGRHLIKRGDRAFFKISAKVDEPALLLFTSGTTGTSKGVLLSQKNLCSAAYAACDSMDRFTSGIRLISVLPMNHTYELTCSHLASQYFGTVTYLNDSLKYFSRNMQNFKPEALVLVPLFVETLHKKIFDEIRSKGLEKRVRAAIKVTGGLNKVGIDLRRRLFTEIRDAFGGEISNIVCGGAPLDPQLVIDFNAFGIEIQEGYGITECSPLVAVNRLGHGRPGSCGQSVFGCKVKIGDDVYGDGTGEILVKGPNVMMGYYKNERATSDVFTLDGYFKTGDIGYIDKDGYIYITGRKKNVIILSNGKNVFPEEIEEYLAKCRYIRETVVLGRENAQGEVVITALIYPNYDLFDNLEDEHVYSVLKQEVAAINEQLPRFKKIRNIEIRQTEFEKTSTLKIQRYKINNATEVNKNGNI